MYNYSQYQELLIQVEKLLYEKASVDDYIDPRIEIFLNVKLK